MQASSYCVLRKEYATTLVAVDQQLFMQKYNQTTVLLTTCNHKYGILHDSKKIYAYVSIQKINNGFAFKNLENNNYYSSSPFIGTELEKANFIADRSLALEWEIFDLQKVEVAYNNQQQLMIQQLIDYKEEDFIHLYWWRHPDFNNFGDELNPYIVSYLTNKKIKRVEQPVLSDLIAIGSTLNWFPEREKKYKVWGTGMGLPSQLLADESYDISLLRGPLTKSLFQGLDHKHIPYGDPGILSNLIWSKKSEKIYDWGLIVHFTQEHKPWVKSLIDNTPNSILISIKDDLPHLMEKMTSCKAIASTSLHGLIVADSYQIPNIWLWDGNIHSGGQWKFFDYFSGINRHDTENLDPKSIVSLNQINMGKFNFRYFNYIEKIQQRIIDVFPL